MADDPTRAASQDREHVAALSQWRAPRWVVPCFAIAGAAVALWLVFLVNDLPEKQLVSHWDAAWGGFDAVLAFVLLSVAVCAWRRSPRLQGAATAAATLLLVDAWFDVLTSRDGTDRSIAIGQAVLLEIPLALLCLLVAHNTERYFLRPVLRIIDGLADDPPQPPAAPDDAGARSADGPAAV